VKIAMISDIHGNATALEAVLNDIERKRADRICVLGDLCYRGPEPKRALDLIRSLNARVIKGNADEWVVRGVRQNEVPDHALEMMNRERDWIVSQLDEQDVAFLRDLPERLSLEAEGTTLRLFHATPDSLFDIVAPDAGDALLEQKLIEPDGADVTVYAHIHKAYVRVINGKVLINTGSVGLPFDGLAKASYALVEVEDGRISSSIERVAYDVEAVVRQYDTVGYPNAEMMSRIVRAGRIN